MTMSRYFKVTGLIGLIVIVAIVVASIAVFSPELSRFNTYKEVAESGLIEKGWIPDFLPKDAFNIIHQHDLDTSETVVEFSFKEPFVESLRDRLRVVPNQSVAKYQKEASEIGWEFKDVTRATYYEKEDAERSSVLAIDDLSKRALYWEAIKRSSGR